MSSVPQKYIDPSQAFDDERTRFLHRVIAAPGILRGIDLISGCTYSRVVPANLDLFLAAHCLGPAQVSEPPEVEVTTAGGEMRRARTFIRSCVLPCGDDDRTTHVAVRFKTDDSLSPSEAIVAASLVLTRACIEHFVERSVMVGVWVIWVVFPKIVGRAYAQTAAHRMREILRGVGIVENDYRIPLLEEEPTPLHLPGIFFSGGYFGCLYRIDTEANLRPVVAGSPEGEDVHTDEGDPSSPAPKAEEWLDELLDRWFTVHGDCAVRAGDLVAFARQQHLLPKLFADLTPQAAVIGLGRELLRAVKGRSTRIPVTAHRSGHSNVFRIGRGEIALTPATRS